jgi:hypothetical protein
MVYLYSFLQSYPTSITMLDIDNNMEFKSCERNFVGQYVLFNISIQSCNN